MPGCPAGLPQNRACSSMSEGAEGPPQLKHTHPAHSRRYPCGPSHAHDVQWPCSGLQSHTAAVCTVHTAAAWAAQHAPTLLRFSSSRWRDWVATGAHIHTRWLHTENWACHKWEARQVGTAALSTQRHLLLGAPPGLYTNCCWLNSISNGHLKHTRHALDSCRCSVKS
jgi:hypothetical protein